LNVSTFACHVAHPLYARDLHVSDGDWVAEFPTTSFALTVTETVPVPSAIDVNVAVAKSAGNVNVLFDALNSTVQAAVLPATEHVEADVLAHCRRHSVL